VNGLTQRLGASLRRAPYVWLVATVLLMLVMDSVLRTVEDEPRPHDAWIAVAGIGSAVYSVVLWFLVPGHLRRRARVADLDERVAILRWSFAISPYFFCYAAVVAGASPWTWAVGYLTSIALLVTSARRTRREASTAPAT
jgi:hypothetical protein